MGKLTLGALRAVLVVTLAGTVFVQASTVWALATDPEDGSIPLTPLRVITILGMAAAQVALVSVWRLVTMVRRATLFSHAAFRYVDAVIGAVVAAALLWFAVTVVHAPGQRDDPGVTAAAPKRCASRRSPRSARRSRAGRAICCAGRRRTPRADDGHRGDPEEFLRLHSNSANCSASCDRKCQ